MLSLALSNGEIIIVVVLVAIPIAVIAFLGAGSVYDEIGKGAFAMDHEKSGGTKVDAATAKAVEQAEIRQMLEAKAYRQRARGEQPIDVEEEIKRVNSPARDINADPELIAEVRQLVLARNKRRVRQGKEPLDVDEEIARQLSDLEGLGQ